MTDDELDQLIDTAAANARWEAQQLLRAEGFAEEADRIEDAKRMLGVLKPTQFGSDVWAKRILVRTLLRIRRGCEEISQEQRALNPGGGRDVDESVHLVIPRRHRKLYRMLGELSEVAPWTRQLLDPESKERAVFVMTGLQSIGIDAHVVVRLRDLGEERRIE